MKSAALILCLAVTGTLVHSGEELDWPACVRETLTRNTELTGARERMTQADADRTVARSAQLPRISGNASASRDEADADTDSYSYGVSARQLLFDKGRAKAEVGRSDLGITAAHYAYVVVSTEIRLHLRLAFVELLHAQAFTGIAERILARRRQHRQLVDLRYEAGREHKGALLMAKAKEAEATFERTQAGRRAGRAQMRLAELMGRDVGSMAGEDLHLRVQGSLAIAGQRPSPSEPPNFGELAARHPLLHQRATESEMARQSVLAAQASRWPSVQATADLNSTHANSGLDDDTWSVGVRVSAPIFEGRELAARVTRAQAEQRVAQADARREKYRLVSALHARWTEWRDACDNVRVREKFLTATQERATIASAQYSAGTVTFDNWIIIEDNLVVAEKALLAAQAAAWKAEAEWNNAQGRPLTDEAE